MEIGTTLSHKVITFASHLTYSSPLDVKYCSPDQQCNDNKVTDSIHVVVVLRTYFDAVILLNEFIRSPS